MERYVIDDLIEKILTVINTHRLEQPGAYARWIFGEERDLGINEYGCADAANILYTVGHFPKDPERRAAEVSVLQGMQDPETGLFSEPTHHTLHTTAHCTAAIELYDKSPLYPCTALEKYTTKEGLYALLEQETNWADTPWRDSHMGAGILPCLTNTGMVGLAWKDWYFDWMWKNTDPETGFICFGNTRNADLYQYMAGSFHFFFNHEAERRPMRYPARVVDSCIKLIKDLLFDAEKPRFCKGCSFLDIDVVYCLTRAMRQTPHRFEEGKEILARYAERYLTMLYTIDPETDKGFNDLHCLFAVVCCLAELQSALPGLIVTSRPLKLVLDRRPFI